MLPGSEEHSMRFTEDKEEKKNTKAKAHAVAGWEWFKQAAWLQVLLIVGVVVAIVICIPYIIKDINNAQNDTNSEFFESKPTTYSKFQDYIDGKDTNCNGVVGAENSSLSEDKEGFIVVYYKDNSDDCNTIEQYVEDWYNDFNDKIAKGKLRLYTINCSWVPGDSTKSKNVEGKDPEDNYDNSNITLQQQYEVQQNVKSVYDNQANRYKNSSVTEETLDTRLDSQSGGGTIFTPCFVTYMKNKTDTKYDIANPSKVIFGMESGLSNSSKVDVGKQMRDILNYDIYTVAE